MEDHLHSRDRGDDPREQHRLDQFEVRVQRDTFYPELVADLLGVCGNEKPHSSMNYAIDILNERLDLDLHPTRQDVLKMLSHELLNATRFGGNIFIEPELGENSAVHSCHTAILMNEIFRRAGLLDGEKVTSEVTHLRRSATEACLIHDMGELLGEFNSLSQRIAHASLQEDANVEREVFETALRLALLATDGYSQKNIGPLITFFRELDDVRKAAGIASHEGLSPTSEISDLLQRFNAPEFALNSRLQLHADYFLKLFDITEIRDEAQATKQDVFLGYLVKTIEHIQGARHFTRFAHKGEGYEQVRLFSRTTTDFELTSMPRNRSDHELTVPAALASSADVIGVAKYVESSIGHLYQYASTPNEYALADAARDAGYQTMMEVLNAMSPLVDRGQEKIRKGIGDLTSEVTNVEGEYVNRSASHRALEIALREQKEELLQELRAERRRGDFKARRVDTLSDIETRGRLMSVYQKALTVGYIPKPQEVLLMHRELPPSLTPLEPLRMDWWRAFT